MAVRDGSGRFQVDVIDVGQGDSILLEGPDGTTMLVDSGHWHDDGEHVLDHLDERGIDRLDYLVATHDDWDHIGGHAAIIEEFGSDGIGAVYGPAKEEEEKRSPAVTQYKTALTENGMEENELHEESNGINLDGATIDVLNPSPSSEIEDVNENSLVIQATYGEQSALLTGDVGHSTERQLVDAHSEQLDDVDVLKTAHHGSKFSTGEELLERCEPETVLYSHAEEGKHDHPDTETVTRTTQADKAYSTALHGTTSLEFDGQHDIAIEHTKDTDLHDATDFAAAIHYQRDNDVALDEIDSIARSDLPANIPYEIVDNASIIEDSQEVQELQNQLDAATESLDAKDDVIDAKDEELDAKDQTIDAKDEALDAKDQTIDAKDQKIEQLQNENEALKAQAEEIEQLRDRLEELEQANEEQTADSEEQAVSDATERETTEKTPQNNRGEKLGNGSQPTDDQTNSPVEEFRSRANSDPSQTSVGDEMANSTPKTENPSDATHSTNESDDEGDDESGSDSRSHRRRR